MTSATDYLLKMERDIAGGFLHLLVLAQIKHSQPIHGYGLIKAMEESTETQGQWKEGTVYPLLASMEDAGLVRSRWGKGSTGPRRKYYQLTPRGDEIRELALLKWRRLRGRLDTILENNL